jgi:hypothetical protein
MSDRFYGQQAAGLSGRPFGSGRGFADVLVQRKGRTVLLADAPDILMTDEDRKEFVLEAATEIDADVRATTPSVDTDDMVRRDYNRSWRGGKFNVGDLIGSDYDYWSLVVNDAFNEFDKLAKGARDIIADHIAGFDGYSQSSYPSALTVWENGIEVSRKHRFEGPRIEIGPSVDFALFLENWNTGNLPNIPVLQMVGVLHLVARALHYAWAGVHHIYATAIKPNSPRAAMTPRRSEAIELFPLIVILPRHYGEG